MSHKPRFGVIGAGAFAETCHLPGLLASPDAEVVAIAGRRRDRAEALAQRFGIPHVEPDAAALCARDDIDGVAICTPNEAHREAALLAFAHGKHVLCEKPLALDVPEAEAMLAAAQASGRIHQVAFTYRYLYGVGELRRRVAAGDIGEPYLFRGHHEFWDGLRPGSAIGWRELAGHAGGGVLWDSGSHMFDLARHLVGPVAAVRAAVQLLPREAVETASGERHAVETDDQAMAWLRFAERRARPLAREPDHADARGRLRAGDRPRGSARGDHLARQERPPARGRHRRRLARVARAAAARGGVARRQPRAAADDGELRRSMSPRRAERRRRVVRGRARGAAAAGGEPRVSRRALDGAAVVMTAAPPARRSLLSRLPVISTIATDAALLAALVAWQWAERQPIWRAPWQLPIALSLVSLGCGAVALIACRRANRVLLFLLDLAAVLLAAWLFNHLYGRLDVGGPTRFWVS